MLIPNYMHSGMFSHRILSFWSEELILFTEIVDERPKFIPIFGNTHPENEN